ncbi:hypothetical protein [Streptomyces sp. SAI-149]|uniref:hypothetical protein n=1 Tax=unclassified Streptomyces TaxID=2593676 RepID=UPI002475176C|nr:hypothetical protein [Streptomyces sp. SAI-149]MDH6502453.1 hypothetical protein [Streptomyces sp. SAI-149]
MTRTRKYLSLGMAALALTAGGVIAAPSASAAASAECGVRASDGRLWCGNGAPAILRSGAYHEANITGQLYSTFSWFDCWTYGGLHGGGNTTWYHTKGDWTAPGYDGWGYVPADWVNTPSSFDADPSARGLRHC